MASTSARNPVALLGIAPRLACLASATGFIDCCELPVFLLPRSLCSP